MRIDLMQWNKRNLAINGAGEVGVRPGLRKVLDVPSGRKFIDGFSVRNPSTEETIHYLTTVATANDAEARIEVYDEEFQIIQRLPLNSIGEPRVVTHAVINGQILITSPDFSAVWGVVGGNLQLAEEKDSVNTGTTATPIPRGICVAWGNRAVIAADNAVYFSDPYEPRTFVAGNLAVGDWEGRIYGLTVTSQQTLCVATQDGIHLLPFDAATAGQFADASLFVKANDETALSYDSIVSGRGSTWAITRRGVRGVVGDSRELFISDSSVPRVHGPSADFHDYRLGRLFGGQSGLWLSIGNLLWHFDQERSFWSWWSAPNVSTFHVRGILKSGVGDEFLVEESDVYRVFGNFDGDAGLTSEGGTSVKGGFSGYLRPEHDSNLQPIAATWASDTTGDIIITHQGKDESVTIDNTEDTPPQIPAEVGTGSWGDGDYLIEPRINDGRAQFAGGVTEEAAFEFLAENPLSRVATMAVVEHSPVGKERWND